MEPFGKGKKRNLPVFDRKNKNLINTINYIFNYKDIPELKNADVILMEEFYKNDGFFDSDVDKELFKKLLQFHPNLNVVMKLHPRSVENRFSNDFFVMENNGIPWEVYSMNCDLQDKILISLSCSTMASTKLLFGDEIRSLLLYPILLDEILKKEKGKSYFNKNFRKKLNDRRNLFDDKSKYYVANSFNDANDKLTQWTGELNN